MEDDTLFKGKHAANNFANNYQYVSNIAISIAKQREARREQREKEMTRAEEATMEKGFTQYELEVAL